MVLGLPEEVLAATKASFEPYFAYAGREQTGRVCQLRRAAGNGNAAEVRARGRPGARLGASAPATVTAQLTGARRHGGAQR